MNNNNRRRNFRIRSTKNNFRRRNGSIGSNKSSNYNSNGNVNFHRNGSPNNIHGVEKAIQKFQQLAKDAQSNGDPILAQNYYQHADHYLRKLNELIINSTLIESSSPKKIYFFLIFCFPINKFCKFIFCLILNILHYQTLY